jgi:low affinity Fe/Cu permease
MNSILPTGRAVNGNSHGKKHAGKCREAFRKFANATAGAVGSPVAFFLASATVIVWAMLGPHYKYSDTWQLVINTGTTIVTFLMVFLIQNTQNRDARAIHLKLDELVRGNKGARNKLVDLEHCSDEEIEALEEEFKEFRQRRGHRIETQPRHTEPSHSG